MSHVSARGLQAGDGAEERAHLRTIDQRDAAEECLSQMYYLVTGNSPEWSNLFGHEQALEDVGDAVSVLKQSAKAAPDMLAALKQIEGEMRAGLGSSYGETREQVRRAIAKAGG
jgi:hypothetical protein